MELQDLLADGYGRIVDVVERVLHGLTEDDLNWQPRPDCNSIGWLVWHLTRQQDAQISALTGENQLWIEQGWHTRFGREANPEDIGFGHTPEQLAAFESPDVETLVSYNRAVVERSKVYFQRLSAADLDRELDEPWFQPLPTVGARLISIMDDSILHAGQAAYVRGLRQGKGWQKY